HLASRVTIETLMALDDSERGAGSGEIAASSSNQGTEPGWPRVFHCDLNEQAELPLLAEPRLGAEQVGGLYAGEEITAVGQQGDWLHVRLYEEDEDEDNDDGDEDDDDSHDDDDDGDEEDDEDDDEDDQDQDRRYPEGDDGHRARHGGGRNRRNLDGEIVSCGRCNAEHLQEPLVWALRRTAGREYLRPGPCLESSGLGWDGLDVDRLPPPVDQAGPRPGPGQRGSSRSDGGGALQPPYREESKE
ncbi:unnamed protein product, partial [Ectocarpus sp. 13 AM-2016]